ncbi:ATP-binding protein [Rhizobium bangladeshense]|uniref:ATP-binding protein n=1 Tax=Rhizobium bangladeshense TaxID=1138189 RepID=UPI0007E53E45|nr:winged helix-turn-helix domain-containing protein [Rhizobium bangladeshense]
MTVLFFDEFELDLANRRLSEKGEPLRLGSRAFDILAALAVRAGSVVTKEELLGAVWPTTSVAEGALRVHLVSLRKTLGDRARGFIDNIPGRGYQFLPPVRTADTVVERKAKPPSTNKFPRVASRIIGRDAFIESTVELLSSSRLLTITGPGGIGKTSVAIRIAERFSDRFKVVFLDLASLQDGKNLLPSLASHLGLNVYGTDVLQAVASELRKTATLLLFDNCEHVIDDAAQVAESILQEVPSVTILATSRERLRAQLERVRELPPLGVPPEGSAPTDAEAFPALELFVSVASLVGETVQLSSPEAISMASEIVRRLDGIPLAIELAAARALDLDISALHESVARPLALLRRGRRNAPQRQQTMQATLDWSFQTMSPEEKELLLRLSTFAGTFTSEDARCVARKDLAEGDFYENFDALFLKSLVSASGDSGTYRLLVTTRDYAAAKLKAEPYARSTREAHARFCLIRLDEARADWTRLGTGEWSTRHGALVHDLRSAMTWAFSEEGDKPLGVELAAMSNVVWTQLGFMAEHLELLERAKAALPDASNLSPLVEMHLILSHAGTMYHVKSSTKDSSALDSFGKAREIAKTLRDNINILRATGGITAIHTMNGDYLDAIEVARGFDALCGNAMPGAVSRMLNHNLHYIGDFDGAISHATTALDLARGDVRGTLNNGASYDQRISALSTVVKTKWVQGRLTEAMTLLRSTLAEATALDHAISLCLYLAVSACPTAFGMRETELGASLVELLAEKSETNNLLRWQEWGQTFAEVASALADGDTERFNRAVGASHGARFENCLISGGELASLNLLERALSKNAGWCRAELYRLKGKQIASANVSAARDLMRKGYDLASEQGAGFWALRCAADLAEIAESGQSKSAKARLRQAMEQFDSMEAFADVRRARDLL